MTMPGSFYCQTCGTANEDGWRYCARCGRPLSDGRAGARDRKSTRLNSSHL